jgi:1-phosphofructokinase family hexose kinase
MADMKILTVTLHPAIDKFIRVPQLNPDGINRIQSMNVYGGGKGNNAARALTRLGASVIATGFQGGYTGRFISEELAKEGIQTEFVFCEQPTRISTLLHEESSGYTYAIYEPGQEVTQAEIEALMELYTRLLGQVSVCLLCGSGQTELLAPVYAGMIEIARGKEVRTLLDSSGRALTLGIEARPSVVKINRSELAEHLDRPLERLEDEVSALIELQCQGIEIAALTKGKDGMLITDGKQVISARLVLESVRNTVGCGDSTLAGMALALQEGKPLAEIARWGVACGSANTQVPGAGFIDMDLVSEMLPRVELRDIITPATAVSA